MQVEEAMVKCKMEGENSLGWTMEGPDVSVNILPRHLFMVNERELLQGFKSFTF